MSYSSNPQSYAEKAREVNDRLNGTIPPPQPQPQQTVQATVVSNKKKGLGFSLPAFAKLDPSFHRHYRIGRDACMVVIITKLAVKKVAAISVILGVVNFQVVIPVGFALMIAGAATGKPRWIEWGASVAIGASFGIWLFL